MGFADEQCSIRNIYDDFNKKYGRIINYDDNVTKEEYQAKTKECIIMGKKLFYMVTHLDLFSKNETIDEIQTSYIRYLYLPAMIANLLYSSSTNNRQHTLNETKTFYNLFFSYILNYQLVNEAKIDKIKELLNNKITKNENPYTEREERIHNLKEQKKLEFQLKELENNHNDNPDTDDTDTARQIYLLKTLITIDESINSYQKILEEEKILESSKNLNTTDALPCLQDDTSDKNKMIFIRLNKLNKVFGYGYPSLPTMSQDEYFLHEIATNKIVTKYSSPVKEEVDEDREEEQEIKRKEDCKWDEFKDANRRGSGNRYNHG